MIEFALWAAFAVAAFASTMFAGAEQSVGAISRDSLEKMTENGVPGARRILHIAENRRRFQLLLLIGRLGSATGGAVIMTYIMIFSFPPDPLNRLMGALLGFAVSVLVFTSTVGVLARIVSVGDHEDSVTRFSPFLMFFHILLSPLTAPLDFLAAAVIKPNVELAAKEEALKEFVKSESELGVIEESEGEMIRSILEFSDTTVREVMVPRIDMIAADVTTPADTFISLFKTAGHSRIPVYDGRIDNIVGVLYAKDLLIAIAEKGRENVSVAGTMRPPYFAPESKRISELLNDLRLAKVHLAIVVDEYGGTSGIVALEDLIEEIVGEIQDEYDTEEHEYTWLDDGTLFLDAGINIDELNEILRIDIPNEDFDTLAGFLYHRLGYIPEGGEEITWEGVTFTVREIIGNRISKVSAKIDRPDENGENTEF